jgi:DNA-binding GntR family transcriptional regulator
VPQQNNPSPRGTYQKIADQIRLHIEANPQITELPTATDIMTEHNVSRGLALRAMRALRDEGIAEPVSGGRWQVIRDHAPPSRPLHEQLAEVITRDNLQAGDPFPSSTELMARFDASRPTLTKALDRLHAHGLVSAARQGKPRIVLAVPGETPAALTVGDLRRALEGLPDDTPLRTAVVVDRESGNAVTLRAANS